MKRALLLCVTVAAVGLGSRASAHHSFPSSYQADREMTIEGELVQVVYRNPHSVIQLMIRDSSSQPQRWSVEWDGRARLDMQGITGATLKAGDHLIITGFPGPRREDRWLRLRSIFRPKDGWRWMGMVD